MPTIALVVSDGTSLIEVAATCEIFGVKRPDLSDSWYDFFVCGPDDARLGGWFRPDAPRGLDELLTADTVIVPACIDIRKSPCPDLIEALRAAHRAGARMVSICTGAFVLAAAGLLDGRRATTHWMHTAALAARYPRTQVDPNVLYVDEGTVLTSAGRVAGIDLCLHIVQLDYGAAIANELARRLVAPPHRDGDQAQFITIPVRADGRDSLLATLAPWVNANLDQPLTVADLARRVNMSTRNLTRRFNAITGVSPLQWLLTRRINRAMELLETTNESIEWIASQTGMGTAATLRRHFSRSVGVPPDRYRRAFRGTPIATPGGVRP